MAEASGTKEVDSTVATIPTAAVRTLNLGMATVRHPQGSGSAKTAGVTVGAGRPTEARHRRGCDTRRRDRECARPSILRCPSHSHAFLLTFSFFFSPVVCPRYAYWAMLLILSSSYWVSRSWSSASTVCNTVSTRAAHPLATFT